MNESDIERKQKLQKEQGKCKKIKILIEHKNINNYVITYAYPSLFSKRFWQRFLMALSNIYLYECQYIYIYIYIERERRKAKLIDFPSALQSE